MITIRKMTAGDIPAVVQVHMVGFVSSRSTQLGRPFVTRMYEWFQRYQPDLAFVAEMDGIVVGFVTGAIGGSSRKIFRYAWRQIALAFLRRPALVITAGMFESWSSYLRGLVPSKRPASLRTPGGERVMRAVLTSIAVSPKARGKQAGKALMAAFEDAARAKGATHLGLGVEMDNPAARGLYEACGWRLVRENPESNSVNYAKKAI